MTKTFNLMTIASREFVEDDSDKATALAIEMLRDRSHDLVGPRGGRYEGVGDIYKTAIEFVPWRGEWHFMARVEARYVRPRR